MEYEQLEQKLLNKAIEKNDIPEICDTELAWGTVIGITVAYYNKAITLETMDKLIEDTKERHYSGNLIKDMYEEWKQRNNIK